MKLVFNKVSPNVNTVLPAAMRAEKETIYEETLVNLEKIGLIVSEDKTKYMSLDSTGTTEHELARTLQWTNTRILLFNV